MTIETDYDIGDSVWFMFSDKIEIGKIAAIKTYTTATGGHESYNIDIGDHTAANNIQKVFPTKEELLKSL